MPRSRLLRFIPVLAVGALFAVNVPIRADYSEEQLKADLKLFDDAKLPHGDRDLLAFFRNRLLDDKDRERIEGFTKKLSSNSFKEREQARIDVEKEGPRALSLLRKLYQSNAELEAKLRAERSIKAIEAKSPNTLVMAAARILRHRQVAGAAAILLEYLADAPDEAVEEEICIGIYGLALAGAKLNVLPPAVKAGELDPILMSALADKEPKRRAIAALAVASYGDAAQRRAAAKLLIDEVPAVRFRAAQGLALARDKSSLPVLIDLLEKGPLNLALQAEDLLSLIAQEHSPGVPLGESKELRQKCHAAWKEWWDKNNKTLELTKIEVDSPFGTAATRAGNGAMAFLKTLFQMRKLDLPAVAKVTDVPFTLYGEINFSTRQEFDDFLKKEMGDDKGQAAPPDFKLKVSKVVPAAEYLKNAAEKERAFLQAARPAQVYVVFLSLQLEGLQEVGEMPIFIRLSGGRARSIGMGLPAARR